MNRRVERQLIDRWMDRNFPNAITKLSNVSGIPATSINKIRYGRAPKKEGQRLRLCEALGVDEDALFPVVESGDGGAP